jgi:hypothetical protein
VQLVGDEVEDVRPVGLGRVAAVAVVPTELLEVMVQSVDPVQSAGLPKNSPPLAGRAGMCESHRQSETLDY